MPSVPLVNDSQSKSETTMKCPICDGTGIEVVRAFSDGQEQLGTCVACGGEGELPILDLEDQPHAE